MGSKYAVNLLSDLGTKGYFEPGFASVDFTSACNLFFGGSGAIFYTDSGQISLAEEMYDNGELGFFPVPDTEGMDNMSTNIPIHSGFAEGFNKATYDDTMQEFFDYMCENYSDACYNQAQIFSPFNEDLPEGLPQLYYDTKPMFFISLFISIFNAFRICFKLYCHILIIIRIYDFVLKLMIIHALR